MSLMQIEPITSSALKARCTELCSLKYRLVQISCTKTAEGMELTYSFDKDYALINLRLTSAPDGAVPSIQAVYTCAFTYENEIAELFGVTVTDMAVDFSGRLYKCAVPAPFGYNISIQEA